MAVTEQLMLPGTFDLSLLEDTPKADVLDKLAFFGTLFILDGPIDVRKVTDAQMKTLARYVGILRRRPTVFSLSGVGVLSYLGDDQGKGTLYEAVLTQTAATFSTWVNAVLSNMPTLSVVAGTITSPAGGFTVTNSFQYVTPRSILDWLMQYFTQVSGIACAYRVNANATLDAGPTSGLFKVTPTAVVQRTPGGRDTSIVGIPATTLELNQDVEDYATRVLYFGGAGAATGATISPGTSYKDLRGNTLDIRRSVSNSQTPAAAVSTMASAEAVKTQFTRQQLVMTSDEYDIGRDVAVGDNIWAYDPQRGLVDTTNQVRYRGSVIFPKTLQVVGMTWPLERGLGVYYRDSAGVYTDLTPFVAYEQPGVSFEVGAAMRRLT